MRQTPTQDEVLAFFDQLSNWGRWGEDDTLGTLNLITPEKRRQGGWLIREGITVSCSKLIPRHGVLDGMSGAAPLSYMVQSGERYALGDYAENPRIPGARMVEFAAESLTFVFHGGVFTHIDDLSHVFYEGKMYNGRSSALVKAAEGATVQNSEVMRDGILTKGILYDIPRLRGRDVLEPEDHVFPEDLDEFERTHGVRAEPGDVLFVRTGYAGQVDALAPDEPRLHAHSGWSVACMPWLRERDVALIGADVATDANPRGDFPLTGTPVHQVAIVVMGMRLIDNAHLERLAQGTKGVCGAIIPWLRQVSDNRGRRHELPTQIPRPTPRPSPRSATASAR